MFDALGPILNKLVCHPVALLPGFFSGDKGANLIVYTNALRLGRSLLGRFASSSGPLVFWIVGRAKLAMEAAKLLVGRADAVSLGFSDQLGRERDGVVFEIVKKRRFKLARVFYYCLHQKVLVAVAVSSCFYGPACLHS